MMKDKLFLGRFPCVDMINISFVAMWTKDDMFTAGRSLGGIC